MDQHHIEIFNEVLSLPEFHYSGKEIAEWSGFNESKVSRFRKGKVDLGAGEFFFLLGCMPQVFQERYWEKMLGRKICNYEDLRSLVLEASGKETEVILRTLADKYSKSKVGSSPDQKQLSLSC